MTTATPEYLNFELMPRASGRRTDTWRVSDRADGFLGRIGWFPRWRRYAFTAASGSVWSAGCMAAVIEFIEARMAERKVA